MIRTCEQCLGPLGILQRAGARFCTPRCRAAANRGAIPAELRRLNHWVTWTPVIRKGIETKMPTQLSGRAASSTDPSTWSSYAQVRGRPRKGFVLGEGIACIDLDHCLTGGRLLLWAHKVLRQCPATYVEISPSGDGIHIWGTGRIEPGRKVAYAGGTVEAYSAGRYITVTGNRFEKSPGDLGDLSPFLNSL